MALPTTASKRRNLLTRILWLRPPPLARSSQARQTKLRERLHQMRGPLLRTHRAKNGVVVVAMVVAMAWLTTTTLAVTEASRAIMAELISQDTMDINLALHTVATARSRSRFERIGMEHRLLRCASQAPRCFYLYSALCFFSHKVSFCEGLSSVCDHVHLCLSGSCTSIKYLLSRHHLHISCGLSSSK